MRGFELWMSGARDNHSDHRPIFFVSVFARTRVLKMIVQTREREKDEMYQVVKMIF